MLSLDVVASILMHAPDFRTLGSAVLTSKIFYEAFDASRKGITHKVAANQFGIATDGVLSLASLLATPPKGLPKVPKRQEKTFDYARVCSIDKSTSLSNKVILSLKHINTIVDFWLALWTYRHELDPESSGLDEKHGEAQSKTCFICARSIPLTGPFSR